MILRGAASCLLLAVLLSCSDQSRPAPPIGEAYVGPSALNLRRELAAKSAVAATVKHGERLEIIEYRHRLVKVRTAQGAEGWTDMRQLLTPAQMDALHQLSGTAAHLASQGTATVFESLNMHTDPSRSSPSFWQIPENGKVDVVGRQLTPRTQAAPVSPVVAPVKIVLPRKKDKSSSSTKMTLHPPAPKLPGDWQALSVPKLDPPVQEASKAPAPPTPMDDWSLVRTPDGKAGWVLTRPLSMAIPDEVAQYAEGHRIMSYFPLGQIQDGDSVKNNWLWTTVNKGLEPYDFDSFRVFVWSRKHHRYETAYIERNVVGHFPTRVENSNSAPSFSVILEDDEGHLFRKTYSFEGFRVRMVNKQPYSAPPPIDIAKAAPLAPATPRPAASPRSLWTRLKDRARRLFR